MAPKTTPLRDRLFRRLMIQPDGCVVWTGCTQNGYGAIRTEPPASRYRSTHVVMWELFNGPVPDGLELDHLCRNRLCANLSHLEAVTHQENVLRGAGLAAANARKTECPKGHPLDGTLATGERYCKTCSRARCLAAYYARKKGSV